MNDVIGSHVIQGQFITQCYTLENKLPEGTKSSTVDQFIAVIMSCVTFAKGYDEDKRAFNVLYDFLLNDPVMLAQFKPNIFVFNNLKLKERVLSENPVDKA
jgi:hypothetical protein